jgi:hypothetical protein
MHANLHQSESKRSGPWDAAAGGIFPGLLGGIAMALLLVAAGSLSGRTPGQVLGAFDPVNSLPLRGALMHLAVSCVYGVLFGIIVWLVPSRLRLALSRPLLGVIYGLLLWLVAIGVLRQAAASLLAASAPAVFLLAHLLFGLVLGLVAGQRLAVPESVYVERGKV